VISILNPCRTWSKPCPEINTPAFRLRSTQLHSSPYLIALLPVGVRQPAAHRLASWGVDLPSVFVRLSRRQIIRPYNDNPTQISWQGCHVCQDNLRDRNYCLIQIQKKLGQQSLINLCRTCYNRSPDRRVVGGECGTISAA
jgi:hypothetical protein